MAFWSPKLTTSLATTHLPLAGVPRAISPAAVERAVYWLAVLLARLGHAPPRVGVAALNPHAGEGGLFGDQESTRIAPGIVRARERLQASGTPAIVEGPIPAESAFRLALQHTWDGIAAMYHDQATIAMKLVGFGDAVNVSLGLPIVRTSVDHGTGDHQRDRGRPMSAACGLPSDWPFAWLARPLVLPWTPESPRDPRQEQHADGKHGQRDRQGNRPAWGSSPP